MEPSGAGPAAIRESIEPGAEVAHRRLKAPDRDEHADVVANGLSLLRPVLSRGEEIVVDVEILGSVAQVVWSPSGVDGDPLALARLQRVDGDLDDPVHFLLAVRSAFGDSVRARFTNRQ